MTKEVIIYKYFLLSDVSLKLINISIK